MSKRENDDVNEQSKRQKPDEDDTNETTALAAIGQREDTQPAIFKLNAIFCEDLFDWLSLQDLHSLGQTCKRMNRLTGLYFQENIKQLFDCTSQNLFSPIWEFSRFSGFVQYITSVKFIRCNLEDFRYVDMNFDSIREISFTSISLTKSLINCVKSKLNQIESIHFHSSSGSLLENFQLYEDLLKFFSNLTHLCIKKNASIGEEWMCHNYPKLQHLRLKYSKSSTIFRTKFVFAKLRNKPKFSTDEQKHIHQFQTKIKCFEYLL